ncbi:DsbA family oxidoreductase [Marinomonas epiphytica]
MKIEFFHDVVCAWCYIQSPVLRKLSENYQVDIIHRNFILQRNDEEMRQRWGSLESAKQQILKHWMACREFEGKPERFNIVGMQESDFLYPNGQLAAQATKAAELIKGQAGHWEMFDTLQVNHLQQAKNVGEIGTIYHAASQLGYDMKTFLQCMQSDEVQAALDHDAYLASFYQVKSIPTMIVNGQAAIRATTKYHDLVASLQAMNLVARNS